MTTAIEANACYTLTPVKPMACPSRMSKMKDYPLTTSTTTSTNAFLSGSAGCDFSIHGDTALHAAARGCNLDIIKFLIVESGGNLQARNALNRTPLAEYLLSCDDQSILVDHEIIQLLTGRVGKSLLLLESRLGSRAVGVLADARAMNRAGDHAIHAAVRGEDFGLVEMLIDHGSEANVENRQHEVPLQIAVQNGDAKILKLLLESGCDVNHQNGEGNTPLLIAVDKFGDRSSIVQKKGHLNDKNEEEKSSLLEEVQPDRVNVVRILLDSRATEIDLVHPRTLSTPLHVASASGFKEAVELLLLHGACLHALDDRGNTPLQLATMASRSEIVRILCSRRNHIDDLSFIEMLNNQNTSLSTALHSAMWRDCKTIIKVC
eukprot:GHVH01001875.1.p1 GENE.GHVH01001875.1~~GHVH01001875.1.p1  ORF type:complete len:377 (+),score=62.35 GHVH01001875.1:43-1173(+)